MAGSPNSTRRESRGAATSRVSFAQKREVVHALLEGRTTVSAEAKRYGVPPYQLTAWIGQVMLKFPPEMNAKYMNKAPATENSGSAGALPGLPGLGPDALDATLLPDIERAIGRAYLIELARRAARTKAQGQS